MGLETGADEPIEFSDWIENIDPKRGATTPLFLHQEVEGLAVSFFDQQNVDDLFEIVRGNNPDDLGDLQLSEKGKALVDRYGLLELDNAFVSPKIAKYAIVSVVIDPKSKTEVAIEETPLKFHPDRSTYSTLIKPAETTRAENTVFKVDPDFELDPAEGIIGTVESVRREIEAVKEPNKTHNVSWRSSRPKVVIFANRAGLVHASAGGRGPVLTTFINQQ